jgi:hypothetical protein
MWPPAERSQFRLLTRASAGRLFESELFARDTDAAQFAIWATAFVATPPILVALQMMFDYAVLARRPGELTSAVIGTHRLFFIVYGMLAVALFTAVIWDALVPERRDYEVLGPLPVRWRTIVAARLAAVSGFALLFTLAVNLPAAAAYGLVASSAATPIRALATPFAHAVATTAGGIWMFSTLLLVRSVLMWVIGPTRSARLAVVLQLVIVVVLVEVFLWLPGLLFWFRPALIAGQRSGGGAVLAAPPVWFLGLYEKLLLSDSMFYAAGARSALMWLATTVILAGIAYVVSTARSVSRILETPSSRPRSQSTRVLDIGARLVGSENGRAVYRFTLVSLTRSHRQALVVAMYVGAGLAFAAVGLIATSVGGLNVALGEPAAHLLAPPLVLTYFAVLGMRAVFAMPTDLGANWIFRLTEDRDPSRAVDGAYAALVVTCVAPVSALVALLGSLLWGPMRGCAAGALHLTLGGLLCEITLVGWRKLPFTCSQAPGSGTLRSRLPFYLAGLIVFAYRGAHVLVRALGSPLALAATLAGFIILTLVVRGLRKRRAARIPILFEETPERGAEPLSLSEATG